MQPGRGRRWTIKLPSPDFVLPFAAGARQRKGPRAGSGGELIPWTALHGYAQPMSWDRRTGAAQQPPPPQHQLQQRRHKQRMAPGTSSPVAAASTDVVPHAPPCPYYAAAAPPAATTSAVYWQQQQLQQQHLLHNGTYIPYVSPIADSFGFQHQMGSFVPWGEVRTTNGCFAARQPRCTDGGAFYEGCDDTGLTTQQGLHTFNPFQHQEHPQQQEQEWAPGSYAPYDDGAADASGQGDGDTPQYGGGAVGGVADDFDVLQKEQEEVVAMLAEADKRHEQQLAFERAIQKKEAAFRNDRGHAAQPHSQLRMQRERLMSDAGSTDSVGVYVDASLWRLDSDRSLRNTVHCERSYDSPSTEIPPPSCCNTAEVTADIDKAAATTTVQVADSPPAPPTTPSPTMVVSATTSSVSSKDYTEPAEKGEEKAEEKATSAQEAGDTNANQVAHARFEPEDGKEEVHNEEQATPSSESLHPLSSSRNQLKESISTTPTTGYGPLQPQEPEDTEAAQE